MGLMSYDELVRGWDAAVPENYLKFLVSDVPAPLQALIPYAQVFGVSDDGYRADLLSRVPPSLAEHVVGTVLEQHYDPLMEWLAGPASYAPPGDAYVAFSALLRAADELSVELSILRRTNRVEPE